MVSSNHIPWIIIGVCNVANMVLLYAIRVLLSRENKRRDAEPPDDTYDKTFVTKIDQDGIRVEMKVPKVCGSSSLLSESVVIVAC
jgi:ACS family allantoate permease-like MFS transporter